MWSYRRLTSAAVLLCFISVAFFQLRLQGYTTRFANKFDSKQTPSSRLHFLVPASQPNPQLCRAILSAAALGYPPARLPGWKGEGEFDAAVTHLAKVRSIVRYLDSLPRDEDDDLVLIIDGYDVIMQLPPEILIQRYFAITKAANAQLAERFSHVADEDKKNKNVQELAAKDPNNTTSVADNTPRLSVLFGPDKLCWPEDFRRPACWAVPPTGLPDGAFGVGEEMEQQQPRWLNSGTIMGPVGDLRRVFEATMERIRTTYDPDYICRDSDQMYMSDVWGEQEYGRILLEKPANYTPVAGFQPEEGDRWVPGLTPGQQTEFHIGLDYESSLFQPWAGNENFLSLLTFNDTQPRSDPAAPNAHPPPAIAAATATASDAEFSYIRLPHQVASSLTRLLQTVPQLAGLDAAALLGTVRLGTNLVTRHVYGIFHCTGEKGYLDELWTEMWFFPYSRELVNAAAASLRAANTLSPEAIDGRQWAGATVYPATAAGALWGFPAGAWSDEPDAWIGWTDLCGEHEAVLFDGQPIIVPEPAEAAEDAESPEPEGGEPPETGGGEVTEPQGDEPIPEIPETQGREGAPEIPDNQGSEEAPETPKAPKAPEEQEVKRRAFRRSIKY